MMTVEPAPHEWQAHYLYAEGLSPYFAASRQVSKGGGSMQGSFEADGERWIVQLDYSEGGLVPPESGVTPEGTAVEFEAPLREYWLKAKVDDDVGQKKATFHLAPRWHGLESESGKPAARPQWEAGDGVNVEANTSNIEFVDVPDILQLAAGAVGINPHHFDPTKVHEFSTATDAGRYVRIDRDRAGPVHARDGPIARMGHLLENDRSGYRKVVQDDTEIEGFYHTVTLGTGRVREAWGDEHSIPREIKEYYPRDPGAFGVSEALHHPKVEASYQAGRWDRSLHPIHDAEHIRDELDEAVLSTLNEAGLPVRVEGGTGGTGGSVFVADEYFEATESDRGTSAIPLSLEQIETSQTSVVIRHLRDGLSPVEWDSLDMLVSDGGAVSPADIAEGHGWHPDSVRRALRRIDDLVERSYGEVSLRSHHVADLVHDAVVRAEESVKEAVETGAKALDAVERDLDEAEERLIAWAANHGIHVDRRDAQYVVRAGNLDDKQMSFRQMCRRLLDLWRTANRDVEKLRAASVEYRDRSGPKIRPFSATGAGRAPGQTDRFG